MRICRRSAYFTFLLTTSAPLLVLAFAPLGMPITLLVSAPHLSAGMTYTYNQDRLTIGRHRSNDLTLRDPNRLVSGRHAEIRHADGAGRYEVEDLGSTNRTLHNGRPLVPGEGVALKDGDLLRLGEFTIQVDLVDADDSWSERTTLHLPADDTGQSPSLHDLYRLPTGASGEEREAALRRAVEELAILNEVAIDLGAAHEPKAILDRIVQRAIEAVQASQGLISLVEPNDPEVASRTLVRKVSFTQEHFHVGQYLLGWMSEHPRPLRVNGADDLARHDLRLSLPFASMLCVPLMTRSELAGVLTVCDKQNGPFTERDERLLTIMAAQAAQLLDNARLYEEQQRLVRVQEEMQLAYQIQTNLLPKETPTLPGYAFAGTTIPAQTVGGDTYDFIRLDAHRLALCVADAVGKGLPASLLMANTQATLRSQAPWVASTRECLERANALLHASTQPGAFVTLVYGVLDTRTHTLSYANAGHNRPLLAVPGTPPRELPGGGLVLGGLATMTYEEHTCMLPPGATLLLYSDGLVEAFNSAREQFGLERLIQVVAEHPRASADALMQNVLDAVTSFTDGADPDDDLTMIVVKRTG